MNKESYIEIQGFLKDGVTQKFVVESWAFAPMKSGSLVGGVESAKQNSDLSIVRKTDKYSSRFMQESFFNEQQIAKFGFRADAAFNYLKLFSQVTLVHRKTNDKRQPSSLTFDFYDVFVIGHASGMSREFEQMTFKFKKMSTFFVEVESAT